MAKSNTKCIEYNGEIYNSLAELARQVGIKPVTLGARLRKGMTIEEAIDNNDKRCIPITFAGKSYSSLTELCEEAGISYSIVRCRLQRGESIEIAITKAISITRQGKSGVYKGVPYKSIKSLAKKLGIQESKMRRELKKYEKK